LFFRSGNTLQSQVPPPIRRLIRSVLSAESR